MCGISGFVDKKNILSENQKKEVALNMINVLMHRGSDSYNYVVKNQVVMTHNRLSIVDMSEKSNQPIFNDTGILTYNGEIYNYKKFNGINSYSDTTFLLDFLSKKQNLQKLDGMFAYVFQNYSEKRLYLQVDRFGIKPLYWYEDENFFAWGSELKVFLKLPGIKFIFNDNQLNDFMLYRTNTSTETLIKNVFRMLPGESITFDLTKQKITLSQIGIYFLNEPETCTSKKIDVCNTIKDDIKNSLNADVPVGIQLSGGIDSTLIAVLASKYKAKIHTYSIGMEDSDWNECLISSPVV
jgi:asparagine synthase (glutamine-hydrolysing)